MTERTSGDERRQALEERTSANRPGALAAQLLTAVRFLTLAPPGGAAAAPLGESALFFPVVGLALGAALVALDAALAAVAPAAVRAVLVVALLAAATAGRHLAGVARLAGAARGRAGAPGVLGVLAAGVLVAAEVAAVARLGDAVRATALLLAPALGRWAMVALAFGSRTAGRTAEDAALRGIKFREFAGASVLALGMALAWAEARGLVAAVALALAIIGCRVGAHRVAGGVTAPLVDTVGLVGETLAFGIFGIAAT